MRSNFLIFLFITFVTISILTLQSLLGAHSSDQLLLRLQHSDRAVADLQIQVQQILSRLHQADEALIGIQEQVQHVIKAPGSSGGLCILTQRLGNLSSHSSMLAAGWEIDMDEVLGEPSFFLGWSAGFGIGRLITNFNASGRVFMRIGNPHPPENDQNKVLVRLNDKSIASIQPMREQELCLEVEIGDELSIEEVYGQIKLTYFKFDCSKQDGSSSQTAATNFVSDGALTVPCNVGQKVWHLASGHRCDQSYPQWISGVVERSLNEYSAVVELEKPIAGFSKFVALPAWQIVTSSKASAPHCASLPFKYASLELVTVADDGFAKRYAPHIRSQRCYADARGYKHVLLEPDRYNACAHINIFFKKPCLLAQYLAEHPEGYMVAFLDADTMALVLERGLEEWLRIDADLHFYERENLPEIGSGIYLVRNKPWVRRWLMTWSEFFSRQPSGFSSADNGALHQHLVETIGLNGSEKCGEMYAGLTASVHNRTPYWEFVECTNSILGAPATHKMCAHSGNVRSGSQEDCGFVTIWPRLNFFVIDWFSLGHGASVYAGPVFLHGIKHSKDVARFFYRDVDRCKVRKSAFYTKEDFGQLAITFAKGSPQFFPVLSSSCSQCVDRCMASFTCSPLSLGENPSEVMAAKKKVDLRHLP